MTAVANIYNPISPATASFIAGGAIVKGGASISSEGS
jgi:hypothetical protein